MELRKVGSVGGGKKEGRIDGRAGGRGKERIKEAKW